MEINIAISKNEYKECFEFIKNEWIISDLEHYWKSHIDFTKRKFKFVAENNIGEIVWTLELSIEITLAFIEWLLVNSKYRKNWIGKLLVEKAEFFSKEKNALKFT